MGRPKLTDDVRRDKPLRIRLTPEERQQIDAAAETEEADSSKWARLVLLKAARKATREK